jgi:hypothetical protein
MNVDAIKQAIVGGRMSNSDLDGIVEAIRFARGQLTIQNRRNLTVGQSVEFTSSRTGQPLRGQVRKIALKYVTVQTPAGLWRVPANMLTSV